MTRAVAALAALLGVGAAGAGCGKSAGADPERLAIAKGALDEGQPKRALAAVATATAGPELVVRIAALVEVDDWATVETLLPKVPAGAEKAALLCLFAAERKDVDATKRCTTDIDHKGLDATLDDATGRALGRVYETEHRRSEAELTLRQLATKSPTNANRKAVVAMLEREGFVREAVEFLEAWLTQTPDDKSLQAKLVTTLERKVRGDLLDKRGKDAEASARRILALAPERAQVRFFLADALELNGDAAGAEAERAAAKAAGATPPVPVDAMPAPDVRGLKPGDL